MPPSIGRRHAIPAFRPGDVGEAKEGGDAGETGVGEGVDGLRMRQAKGALGFRHGEAS